MQGLVLFLNGARGLAVLRRIAEDGHGIAAVYAPARKIDDPAIVHTSTELKIPVQPVQDVNAPAFVETIHAMDAELAIIAGFSMIFREPLISTPKYGTINLHAGALPQYRGGSPLNWQIINGENKAGLSVIRVDQGIDSGPVLAEAAIPIGLNDTIADLHSRANLMFPELVLQVLDGFDDETPNERIQDEAQARYWHQRNDEDGLIDWTSMTARQVHDLVRAVTDPYPGAFTTLDGARVRIRRTALPDFDVRGVPGRVCHIQGNGPYVVCKDRAVLIQDYAFEQEDKDLKLSHGIHLGRGIPVEVDRS